MEKENESLLQAAGIEKKFLDDTFHLNTEKPLPLSKRIKNKLKKWAKPFGLGLGAYFLYELVAKLGSLFIDFIKLAYHFTTGFFISIYDTIAGWIDSINFSIFSHTTQSAEPGTISDVANQVQGSMATMTDLLASMAYIAGIGFGFQAALKFKQHSENPDRTPVSVPITMMVVSGFLVFLPNFLTVGTNTIFSQGQQSFTEAKKIEAQNVETNPQKNVIVVDSKE